MHTSPLDSSQPLLSIYICCALSLSLCVCVCVLYYMLTLSKNQPGLVPLHSTPHACYQLHKIMHKKTRSIMMMCCTSRYRHVVLFIVLQFLWSTTTREAEWDAHGLVGVRHLYDCWCVSQPSRAFFTLHCRSLAGSICPVVR